MTARIQRSEGIHKPASAVRVAGLRGRNFELVEHRVLRRLSQHERPGAFVIPNPWDAGTVKMLAQLGYPALATTSAGLGFSLGRRPSGWSPAAS